MNCVWERERKKHLKKTLSRIRLAKKPFTELDVNKFLLKKRKERKLEKFWSLWDAAVVDAVVAAGIVVVVVCNLCQKRVATCHFDMRLLHCNVFLKKLPCFEGENYYLLRCTMINYETVAAALWIHNESQHLSDCNEQRTTLSVVLCVLFRYKGMGSIWLQYSVDFSDPLKF